MQQSSASTTAASNVGFKDSKTKQFDMKTYERMVKQITGRSPTEFREWQSRELLAAKMRDLIKAPVRVAEDEAFDRYKTERTTSTVNYVVVRRSWLEKYAIPARAEGHRRLVEGQGQPRADQGARPPHPREVRGREARGARRREDQGRRASSTA